MRAVPVVVFTQALGLLLGHLAGGCTRNGPEVGAAKPDPTIASVSTPSEPSVTAEPVVATPAPSPCAKPTKSLSAAECKALLARAQKATDAAMAVASKACAVAADCEAVHYRACLADCTSGAVAKVSSAAYDKSFKAIDGTDCKSWYDGNCPATTPMPVPSCPMYVPMCASGKCATRIGP